MGKRQWIDVELVGNYFYWDCPSPRCNEPQMISKTQRVWSISHWCNVCKREYILEQVKELRMLIEEK